MIGIRPLITTSSSEGPGLAKSRFARVEMRSYGFRLSPGSKSEDRIYALKVQGKELAISENYYVYVKRGDGKEVYFATHHNAAYLFSIISHQHGSLIGNETFLHIDSWDHHDANPLEAPLPRPVDSLHLHQMALAAVSGEICRSHDEDHDFASPADGSCINVTNYISAIARTFPKMKLAYLSHVKPERDNSCPFSIYDSVFKYRFGPGDHIASVDLDIFGTNRRTEVPRPKLLKRLSEIHERCKIAMYFTSPGYISESKVSEILDKLIPLIL